MANVSEITGRVVRLRRELKGITLEEMANVQRLSTSGWSRVETGDTEMTVRRLFDASAALGVPAWEILQEVERLLAVAG